MRILKNSNLPLKTHKTLSINSIGESSNSAQFSKDYFRKISAEK